MTTFASVSSLALALAAVCLAWLASRRIAELRRRLAAHLAEVQALRGRFEETVALYEDRLQRLEGVRGAAGSRVRQRRRAAEWIGRGGDPLAVARRCALPAAEAQMLMELDALRAGSTRSAGA